MINIGNVFPVQKFKTHLQSEQMLYLRSTVTSTKILSPFELPPLPYMGKETSNQGRMPGMSEIITNLTTVFAYP